MRYTRHLLVLALVAAASITFMAPSRVNAIVYGFVDTGNVFSNSGAFIVKSPTTGHISPICSGTLAKRSRACSNLNEHRIHSGSSPSTRRGTAPRTATEAYLWSRSSGRRLRQRRSSSIGRDPR